jgi:hypothetical protein
MAKNKKRGSKVVSHTKDARGAEQWCVRTSDGQLETVTTRPSSAKTMDRAAKKYAAAMKRLAKR